MGERFSQAGQWLVLSDAFNRQGKHEDAANVLRVGLRQYPKDANLWLGLGNALMVHGNGILSPAAEFSFRKAIVWPRSSLRLRISMDWRSLNRGSCSRPKKSGAICLPAHLLTPNGERNWSKKILLCAARLGMVRLTCPEMERLAGNNEARPTFVAAH